MKFPRKFFFVFCFLLLGQTVTSHTNNITFAQQEIPPYAKWGSMAMKKTMEKYPEAKIVDYLHIGREKGAPYSIEKFKLWIKEDGKELGVFVDIKFDTITEKLIDIKFRETQK